LLSTQSENINFDLSSLGLESNIYRIRGNHANHYTEGV